MAVQLNAVLEKGKPGVIRGRKANGSASADGRVADRGTMDFLQPISGNRDGFFYTPLPKKDSSVQNIQVGGGTFNPGWFRSPVGGSPCTHAPHCPLTVS